MQFSLPLMFDPVERLVLDMIRAQKTQPNEFFSHATVRLMRLSSDLGVGADELTLARNSMIEKEWIEPTDVSADKWRLTELGYRNVMSSHPVE